MFDPRKNAVFSRISNANLDNVSRQVLSQDGLNRVKNLIEIFNLMPLKSSKVVVIGGTNGKGTSCFCLEALALSQNKRVGLFSSPHVLTINERIRVNGAPISMQRLLHNEETLLAMMRLKTDEPITFFEKMFLIALLIFKEDALDLLIIEVGLGGRFCATNSLNPDLTILTGIDFDHTDILGTSREAIGQEKSGIFRPQIPIVLADRAPPIGVLTCAEKINAPLLKIGRDWDLIQSALFDTHIKTLYHKNLYFPSLWMPAESIAAAIVSFEKLYGIISENVLKKTIHAFQMMGRFQILHRAPPCIVDVAHNPQSLARLKNVLKAFACRHHINKWLVVFSMLKRKDLQTSLSVFKNDPMFAWYLPDWGEPGQFFKSAEVINALHFGSFCIFQSIEMALKSAHADAQKAHHVGVIVAGSFLTVQSGLKYFLS